METTNKMQQLFRLLIF